MGEKIETVAITEQDYSGFNDRELLIMVLSRLDKAEALAMSAMQAAEGNPMLRMIVGKFLP